ncbi:MAG: YbaK/EbsC family protein [Ardenticatenaceae bacterium]|nr:YbaK/EbsC family protein [Ardenticatenaceae bacterium]
MFQKLISFLDTAKVAYHIHSHEPIRTVKDAQEKWPLAVEKLIKTIAFRHRSGVLYLVAVRARSRIDYARLAGLLGHKRRDLASLAPQEVAALLGVEPGEVFPLPLFGGVSGIVFDQQVLNIERSFCGSGRLDKTLEIETKTLIRLADGVVGEVVKSPLDDWPKSLENF